MKNLLLTGSIILLMSGGVANAGGVANDKHDFYGDADVDLNSTLEYNRSTRALEITEIAAFESRGLPVESNGKYNDFSGKPITSMWQSTVEE